MTVEQCRSRRRYNPSNVVVLSPSLNGFTWCRTADCCARCGRIDQSAGDRGVKFRDPEVQYISIIIAAVEYRAPE